MRCWPCLGWIPRRCSSIRRGGKKKKKTMPTTHVGTLLTIIGWQTPFQCGMNPPLNKKFKKTGKITTNPFLSSFFPIVKRQEKKNGNHTHTDSDYTCIRGYGASRKQQRMGGAPEVSLVTKQAQINRQTTGRPKRRSSNPIDTKFPFFLVNFSSFCFVFKQKNRTWQRSPVHTTRIGVKKGG